MVLPGDCNSVFTGTKSALEVDVGVEVLGVEVELKESKDTS